MPTLQLFEDVAAWALRQDRFITSLQLCDQFHVSLTVAGRLIRKLITHPRITAEFKREKCIISDGQAMTMVMVRVTKVVREPMGPPKPAKVSKPPRPKAIPIKKDEELVGKLKRLRAHML